VFNLHSPHSVVSRLHCEFYETNGIFRVRDLGSTQGTFVNGMRILEGGEGQVLLEGDRVELGPAERGGVVLRFHSAAIRLVRQPAL
jgi:pSer/pThr/pTyr-binding forkhead associated (FHA) protein